MWEAVAIVVLDSGVIHPGAHGRLFVAKSKSNRGDAAEAVGSSGGRQGIGRNRTHLVDGLVCGPEAQELETANHQGEMSLIHLDGF